MNLLHKIFLIFPGLLLSGCAHYISIEPNPQNIQATEVTDKVNATVGYYIPEKLVSLEIITPGGGGDNVRYYPYKDIESGYAQMLNNVFTHVVKIPGNTETITTTMPNVDFIMQPQILTISGSSGFFTWPPSFFTIDLTTNIKKPTGETVSSPRVVGNGIRQSVTDPFGLAGTNAMNDALLKTQEILIKLPIFSTNKPQQKNKSNSDYSERLNELKELHEKKLLNTQEYEKKRKEIIESI